MENAEEVMQLLEEFSKIKPKEIPPELEDYLGYVATTGDPVFQWALVKSLFREKLLTVITDFFESTLTVELPPCPNVEPFNYERMKTSLLERLDTFTSAPFTVQRICELLTNPRKEYNRADKYMRAIEKNILVVSTREPGSAKRPLEFDGQQETILNGMPDVKLSASDGSLLHVPTDLPYLGAPPASNDVTIETTDLNVSEVSKTSNGLGEGEITSDSGKAEIDKFDVESAEMPSENKHIDHSLSLAISKDEVPNVEAVKAESSDGLTFDSDSDEKLNNSDDSLIKSTSDPISVSLEEEASTEIPIEAISSELPDSIGSSDSFPKDGNINMSPKISDCSEAVTMSDENEVSSTPTETSHVESTYTVSEESEEPSDSEAQATELKLEITNTTQSQPEVSDETSNLDREVEINAVTITEIAPTKSEISLECNEITGTVASPISPESNNLPENSSNEVVSVNVSKSDEGEQLVDSHPDSSIDICPTNKECISEELDAKTLLESSSEADSVTETSAAGQSSTGNDDDESDIPVKAGKKSSLGLPDEIAEPVSSPVLIQSSEESDIPINLPNSSNADVPEEISASESKSIICDESIKIQEVQPVADSVSEEIFNQEKREESVIHALPQESSNIQHKEMVTCDEEINIDPSCEAEEAMDVDETSNQMMVSEGENEGEPMDQSDQLQS